MLKRQEWQFRYVDIGKQFYYNGELYVRTIDTRDVHGKANAHKVNDPKWTIRLLPESRVEVEVSPVL